MPDIFDVSAYLTAHKVELGRFAGVPSPLSVTATLTTVVDDFSYSGENIEQHPLQIFSQTYKNDTGAQATQRISDTRRTSATTSWTIRQGITSTTNVGLQVRPPTGVGVSISETIALSFERSEQQTKAIDQTWTWDTSIPIEPHSVIDIDILVDEIVYKTQFTARAKISGKVAFSFSTPYGKIGKELGIGDCFTQKPHSLVRVNSPLEVELTLLGDLELREGRRYRIDVTHHPIAEPPHVENAFTFLQGTLFANPFAMDAEIGSPDGIHYTVISTNEVVRMTPACGFNDAGAANGGAFIVETRRYEEYQEGKLLRSWTEEVETFDHCVDV